MSHQPRDEVAPAPPDPAPPMPSSTSPDTTISSTAAAATTTTTASAFSEDDVAQLVDGIAHVAGAAPGLPDHSEPSYWDAAGMAPLSAASAVGSALSFLTTACLGCFCLVFSSFCSRLPLGLSLGQATVPGPAPLPRGERRCSKVASVSPCLPSRRELPTLRPPGARESSPACLQRTVVTFFLSPSLSTASPTQVPRLPAVDTSSKAAGPELHTHLPPSPVPGAQVPRLLAQSYISTSPKPGAGRPLASPPTVSHPTPGVSNRSRGLQGLGKDARGGGEDRVNIISHVVMLLPSNRLLMRSKAAIARLRAYRPPPFALWDRLPVNKRAAVLILLYADRRGDLRVVITMRATGLRSFSGHAAFPGGKADTLLESPCKL